jgi:tRNA (mo5U34)-methyltransferase
MATSAQHTGAEVAFFQQEIRDMDLAEKVKAIPYWYHRIELPDGTVTPGWSPIDASRYCIPEDLTGMRVLDIGAWDGYWTWEALKRGAKEVVAIDDFSDTLGTLPDGSRKGWESFDICREAFGFNCSDGDVTSNESGQRVYRYEKSVYDINERELGVFDVVFFFGTIYHLKHPLLALEKISEVCMGSIYIETASLDEYSPYQGGIGHGFNRRENVMEFYPTNQYGNNDSNWWAPTLQCPLTEKPTALAQCRGFASATKDPEKCPANKPEDIGTKSDVQQLKVSAVMSVPRLGFMDNMSCAVESLFNLRIPLISVQGAFWGQCLERGIQRIIDAGAEIVLTIDYDTVFKQADVEGVLQLMHDHPEASAIIPVQTGRGSRKILTSMKSLTGQPRDVVPLTEMEQETIKVASGHFGLTALRVKDLLEIPHPWFHDQPNIDSQWGPGRVDADIWFWKQLERAGKTALLANRIVVGHLELLATWPDAELQPIYQIKCLVLNSSM